MSHIKFRVHLFSLFITIMVIFVSFGHTRNTQQQYIKDVRMIVLIQNEIDRVVNALSSIYSDTQIRHAVSNKQTRITSTLDMNDHTNRLSNAIRIELQLKEIELQVLSDLIRLTPNNE